MKNFDVIIIGGGPIGLASGIACQNAGLSYVILEKGCLVNSLYNYPTTMTFFSTSNLLEIGDVPFVSIAAKPTRAEALEYFRRVVIAKRLNIRLFEEVLEVQTDIDGVIIIDWCEVQLLLHEAVAPHLADTPSA